MDVTKSQRNNKYFELLRVGTTICSLSLYGDLSYIWPKETVALVSVLFIQSYAIVPNKSAEVAVLQTCTPEASYLNIY